MCFRVVHFIFVNMRSKSLYSYSFSSALFIYLFIFLHHPLSYATWNMWKHLLILKHENEAHGLSGKNASWQSLQLQTFSVRSHEGVCVWVWVFAHLFVYVKCMLQWGMAGMGVAGDAKINLFKILIAFQKKKRKLRQRMNHMLFDFNYLKAVMLRCQQL